MEDDNKSQVQNDVNLRNTENDHCYDQQHHEREHDQINQNQVHIKQENNTSVDMIEQQSSSQSQEVEDPSQIDLQLGISQDVVGEDGLQLDEVVDYIQRQQELEERRRAGDEVVVGQEGLDGVTAQADNNNSNYSNVNGHDLHELGRNHQNNLHLLRASNQNHHDYSNRSSPPSVTGTATAPNSDDDNMMDFDSDDDDADSKSNHSNSNSNLSGIDFQGGGRGSANGSRKSRCSSLNGDGPSTSSGRSATIRTMGPNGDIIIKRSHHNVLERKRRDLIKDSFTKLKDSVPSLLNERASRAQILKKAADFIQLTHDRNENLRNSLNELTKKNKELATVKKVKTSDDPTTICNNLVSHSENFINDDSNNITNQQQLIRANDIKLEDTKKGS